MAEVVEVGVGDRLTLSDKYLAGSFAWFEDGSNRFAAHNDLFVEDFIKGVCQCYFLTSL